MSEEGSGLLEHETVMVQQLALKPDAVALTPEVNASRNSALVSHRGTSASLSSALRRLGWANRLRHWAIVSM